MDRKGVGVFSGVQVWVLITMTVGLNNTHATGYGLPCLK